MYSDKVLHEFRHPHNIGEMKKPDGLGKVGNPVCLPPGSMVHANDEFMEIDLLKVGNRVLGHDGHYNRIQKTISRNYNGETIRIKNKLGVTYLTPEHEVLAAKVPNRWKYRLAKGKKTLPTCWYHARELEKGDLVAYPVLMEETDRKFIEVPSEKKKWDFRSKEVPKKIPVDSDFLRLCGYYLAEGNLREKTTKVTLGLSFNSSETDLADDVEVIVKKLFGIEAKRTLIEKRKTLRVKMHNVFIVRLFKSLFGKGAANKKIPHWMMLLPPEKQKSLIYGLWKGDGYFNEKKAKAGYLTISYQLTEQIKTLLLRQRIIPSIYTENEKRSRGGVKRQKAYRIHIGERNSLERLANILNESFAIEKPIATDSWFNENHLFVPITHIGKLHYSGEVYNLEIENSKSYVTGSLAVHNCGDLIWVYIKVGKNKKGEEIIKDIKVKTFGCVAAIATSSKLTEMVKGMTLKEALKINKEKIAKQLDGLPPQKMHCSVLSMDGLRKAIEDYRNKKAKA